MKNAFRIGLRRGLLEVRKSFRSPTDLFNYFGVSGMFLVAAYLARDSEVGTTGVSFGMMFLASVVGFIVAMGGIVTVGQVLAAEREDGTLLRAKGMPHGMAAYFTAKVVHIGLVTLINTALVLVPAMFFLGSSGSLFRPGHLPLLLVVLALGLAATVPIGAILGALARNAKSTMGMLMLPVMAIVMVSGIFVPMTTMPVWAQWIGQIFPVYWVGLGTRAAILPDEMVVAELAGSWRIVESLGVLGLWALVGCIVAPIVLRRMARRESGSRLDESRERALASVI